MEDGTRLLGDSQQQGWRIICLGLGMDTATGADMYNRALNFTDTERKIIPHRALRGLMLLHGAEWMGCQADLLA